MKTTSVIDPDKIGRVMHEAEGLELPLRVAMHMRTLLLSALLIFSYSARLAHSTSSASSVSIEVDAAQAQGAIRDLLGVNKQPAFSSRTPGLSYDASSLFPVFRISQVRTHDTGIDLCTVYTSATKLNAGVTPQVPVTGCTLSGSGSVPHFMWAPTSSADADLNNPDNYDFSAADAALAKTIATGAKVYLGLAQDYNGPNDTTDPVAWAKVATNIYKHVIGAFKPTAGIAIDPAYVEILNEPDGGAWRGDRATFNTLYSENTQRVRAAASAGKTLKVGGAGFTRNILTNSQQSDNPAYDFVNSVGASALDFYSAHLYDKCANATLQGSAGFLQSLRSLVDSQGGTGKPIHISEWNIGLGTDCGNSFFADQRNQSFASGVLTLMQNPTFGIEAAHYYAGVTVMSLFDFTSVENKVRINPAAWAFWAHGKLSGTTALSTQVCVSACVAGYAAASSPLVALAGQAGNVQNIVITNDGSTSVTYTLRVKGLTAQTVTATINTPPSGAQDIAASGNPIVADATALNTLVASVTQDTRTALTVSNGAIEISVTIPAHSLQLVSVQSASTTTAAQSDCLFNWAEHAYPQFFAPAGATSTTYASYYYRYYSGTGNYLATTSADSDIWVLGPSWGNELLDVGPAADYLTIAGCSK